MTYNTSVPKWSPLAIALLIALLAALGYFSYQGARAYLRWQAIRYFQVQAFDDWPPAPEKLDSLMPEIQEKVDRYGGDTLRLMDMDLLMLHSWYRPEVSVDDLRAALALGQDLYRGGQVEPHGMLRQLSYGYTAAGLPAKLERWQAEVQARAPQLRYYIRFYQVYGRIISDDPESARQLIKDEVAGAGKDNSTNVLALSSYLLLDDLDEAAMYAPLVEQHKPQDNLFQFYYALFLQRQGDFQAALQEYRAFMTDSPADPDDATAQLVPLVGLSGFNDPKVAELLDTATHSTRNPASREAVEAMVAYQLYEITQDDVWRQRISELREQVPADCQVALAQAYAYLFDAEQLADAAAGEGQSGAAQQEPPPAGQSAAALSRLALQEALAADKLAQTNVERQQTCLMLAIVYANLAMADPTAGVAPLDQSVRYLRMALGDPREPDAVKSQRVPDYEYFILDDQVQAARSANSAYDRTIHRVIIDYLNRRQQLFSDVVPLPPLDYGESFSTEVGGSTGETAAAE